jgi:hypothetical protein
MLELCSEDGRNGIRLVYSRTLPEAGGERGVCGMLVKSLIND